MKNNINRINTQPEDLVTKTIDLALKQGVSKPSILKQAKEVNALPGNKTRYLDDELADLIDFRTQEYEKETGLPIGEKFYLPDVNHYETNVFNALALLGVEVRLNTRKERTEYQQDKKGWEALDKGMLEKLRSDIEGKCLWSLTSKTSKKAKPVKFGVDAFKNSIIAIRTRNQVDPFIDYLKGRPKWDRVDRVGKLIQTSFVSDSPPELIEWVNRYIVVGSVKRAFEPGCKMDEMPVLIGGQGIGKSTFFSRLLPDSSFFSDNLNLGMDDNRRVEGLLGNVIVENPELVGQQGARLESLKAFLSRQIDKVRLAFEPGVKEHQRCCIIVGTTNSEFALPNDATGNRRFVPIRVSSKRTVLDLMDYMKRNRDQIWAQGLDMYKKNADLYISHELTEVQSMEAEKHRGRDEMLEDAVREFSEEHKRAGLPVRLAYFTATYAGKVDPKAVAKIMKDEGWEKTRRRADGIVRPVWVFEDN